MRPFYLYNGNSHTGNMSCSRCSSFEDWAAIDKWWYVNIRSCLIFNTFRQWSLVGHGWVITCHWEAWAQLLNHTLSAMLVQLKCIYKIENRSSRPNTNSMMTLTRKYFFPYFFGHQLDELLLLWWPLAVLQCTCTRSRFFYVFYCQKWSYCYYYYQWGAVV